MLKLLITIIKKNIQYAIYMNKKSTTRPYLFLEYTDIVSTIEYKLIYFTITGQNMSIDKHLNQFIKLIDNMCNNFSILEANIAQFFIKGKYYAFN